MKKRIILDLDFAVTKKYGYLCYLCSNKNIDWYHVTDEILDVTIAGEAEGIRRR